MKWVVIIQDKHGVPREIPLDHEYNTKDEATPEAEDIADREYTEDDLGWSLIVVVDESELFEVYKQGGYSCCPVCKRDDCIEWSDIDPEAGVRPFYCTNCGLWFEETLDMTITGVALMET